MMDNPLTFTNGSLSVGRRPIYVALAASRADKLAAALAVE